MSFMLNIESLLKEIVELDSRSKIENSKRLKKLASAKRKELAKLMPSDYMFLSGYYLYRQTHSWGQTVAVYDKDAWNKREAYIDKLKQSQLDWIRQEK